MAYSWHLTDRYNCVHTRGCTNLTILVKNHILSDSDTGTKTRCRAGLILTKSPGTFKYKNILWQQRWSCCIWGIWKDSGSCFTLVPQLPLLPVSSSPSLGEGNQGGCLGSLILGPNQAPVGWDPHRLCLQPWLTSQNFWGTPQLS